MKKFLLGIIMLISICAYSQTCTDTDVQHAYLTVSLDENMTISNAVYSLSENIKVNFAVGNLMYQPKTNTWKLADHQYDFVGGERKEKTEDGLVQKGKYGNVFLVQMYLK